MSAAAVAGKCLVAASVACGLGVGSYIAAAGASPPSCAPPRIVAPAAVGSVDSVAVAPAPDAPSSMSWDGSNLVVTGQGWSVTIKGIKYTAAQATPQASTTSCVGEKPAAPTPPADEADEPEAPPPAEVKPAPAEVKPAPVAHKPAPAEVKPAPAHKPAGPAKSSASASSGTPLHLLPLHLTSIPIG